jgi:hypothetical protein
MYTCKSCRWFRPNVMPNNQPSIQGYCFLKPPVVVMVPIEIPAQMASKVLKPGQQQEPQYMMRPGAARPIVLESDGCSKYFVASDEQKGTT